MNEVMAFTDEVQLKIKKSPVEIIRMTFQARLWSFVFDFYISTRSFDAGLALADYLLAEIEANRETITGEEWDEWSTQFMAFKLALLDRLNRWPEYIALYEAHAPGTSPREHKLYQTIRRRYDVIQRKQARAKKGLSVDHLKRHQQEELPVEVIRRRMADVMRRLNIVLERQM